MTDLCANYVTCKDYQASFKKGTPMCSGCSADISTHRMVTRSVDKWLNKVVERVGKQEPDVIYKRWIRTIDGLSKELDVSKEEANFLLIYRSMERTADAEMTVKLGLK